MRSISLCLKWTASEVPMNTVSNGWAADQPGVLHAAVVGIHRMIEAGGAKQLQRIDDEIQRGDIRMTDPAAPRNSSRFREITHQN